MINLYYWPTPNGHKITIFLEESGLPYQIIPVNLKEGEQFSPDFLKISPNNKIPAIVDHDAPGAGGSIAVFESCAILEYLGEKTQRFLPKDLKNRFLVLEWLYWQASGLGPMAGQANFFLNMASEVLPFAIERYTQETQRLFGVLDKQLGAHEYVAGEYSIADMAIYPWVMAHEKIKLSLEQFPQIQRWLKAVGSRPAIQRAYAKGEAITLQVTQSASEKSQLNQDACSIKKS